MSKSPMSKPHVPDSADIPRLSRPVSNTRDHIVGPPDAAVTLVEYGDFECPYCRQANFVLGALLQRHPQDLRFVFRHFPLSQIHPHAQRAAEAAEAAGAQGQFWEMHELIYENQDALSDADLAEYATQLGLDLPRFVRDLASGAFRDSVRDDFLSGVASGVNGTPSFFINELRYDGPWDLESLDSVVRTSAGSRVPVSRGGRR